MVLGIKKNVCFSLFILLAIYPGIALKAQSNWSVEGYSLSGISGDNTTFWLHSNRFGIIDPNSSNQLVGIDITRKVDPDKFVDFGIGAEGIARISEHELFFFNELYGELTVGVGKLTVGKQKWRDGIWRSDLSVGSMVWSGNAATMPKITLSIPNYVSIPGTHDYVAFRGYISHGWFEDNRFVKNVYLHEKALYLRIMPENAMFNGHVGLVHNVQWGGTHPALGKLPQGFSDFTDVFLGKSADPERSPGGEVINALGNTVGALEGKVDVNLTAIKIEAYRQFFIETSANQRFRDIGDGIWGLKVNFKKKSSGWLSTILWEYINTKSQNRQPGEELGADQYYYNFIYRTGWSYKGRNLGLPLATFGQFNGVFQVVNNIIVAQNIGIKGSIPLRIFNSPVQYKLQTTYSRNYGRTTNCSGDFCNIGDPNPLRTERRDQWYNQFSVKAQISPKFTVKSSLGVDFGEIQDNIGIILGLSYQLY